MTRRERNEFIFLQSVAAAPGPALGAAGMDSKMKVNITDGARLGLGPAPPSTRGESET